MQRRPVVLAFVCLIAALPACGGDGGTASGDSAAPSADTSHPVDVATGGGDASAAPDADCVGSGTCLPGDPEICDGRDNDGDGDFDEDLRRVCNTACGSGTERCVAGSWAGCDAPQPQTEICDGLDNDCDGRVDEDLVRVCETDCGQGREVCSLGSWTGCDAPRPAAETCNGEDDDCDGHTDEDLSRACDSVCGEGAEVCAEGAYRSCTARQPAPTETCDDNVDDDCDGETDEDCGACAGGALSVCHGVDTELRCQIGTRACQDDGLWGPCRLDAAVLDDPSEEVCNGRDDDCDGGVDETFPRLGAACGAGASGAPLDEGVCRSGAWACEGGREVCQDYRAPTTEVCDDLDDDCDGLTDEDLPRDAYERNDACANAAVMGAIREGSPALTWAGSLYPFGDVDEFFVTVEEAGGFCVPSINPDEDYEIAVTLSNVPAGVAYDVCIEITDAVDTPAALCEKPRLLGETCVAAGGEGGDQVVRYQVVTDCFLADHTSVLVKVVPHDGQAWSCEPYALRIEATTVLAP